jgi:hypothetical protein
MVNREALSLAGASSLATLNTEAACGPVEALVQILQGATERELGATRNQSVVVTTTMVVVSVRLLSKRRERRLLCHDVFIRLVLQRACHPRVMAGGQNLPRLNIQQQHLHV